MCNSWVRAGGRRGRRRPLSQWRGLLLWARGGKREFERVREDGDAKKTTTTSSLVVVVCVQALKLIFLCRVFAFGFFASYLFCSKAWRSDCALACVCYCASSATGACGSDGVGPSFGWSGPGGVGNQSMDCDSSDIFLFLSFSETMTN